MESDPGQRNTNDSLGTVFQPHGANRIPFELLNTTHYMKDLRFLTVNLSGKADLKKIKAFKQFNHKKTNHENITLSLES